MSEIEVLKEDRAILNTRIAKYTAEIFANPTNDDAVARFEDAVCCYVAVQDEIKALEKTH